MNLLFTTAGNFQTLESQDRVAVWRSRKHIIELMPMESVTSYLRLNPASSLALIDAIVCVADDPPIATLTPYHSNFYQLDFALKLAEDVRNLPETCAMRDGRKWRSIPFIIFRSAFDHEFAEQAQKSTHANIVFTPYGNAVVALMQIRKIVDDYQDRVLDDYRQMGIVVRFVSGHAQIGPALKKR